MPFATATFITNFQAHIYFSLFLLLPLRKLLFKLKICGDVLSRNYVICSTLLISSTVIVTSSEIYKKTIKFICGVESRNPIKLVKLFGMP